MQRIAAANGVDPSKVPGLLNTLGYQGAKFRNAGDPNAAVNAVNQAHQDRINTALQNDKFDDLKGLQTPKGTIQNIDTRTWTFGGLRDQYSVDLKNSDGTKTTQTFKDKPALTKFIQSTIPSKKAAADKDVEATINKYLPK